jgi:N-formylglutamate amidohydrolase
MGISVAMPFASFAISTSTPIIATAVHNGHDLRPEVDSAMVLDAKTRRREEDAHTDYFASRFDCHVIVNRSRFEVDLNRPRDEAVYTSPEDAWGLNLWSEDVVPVTVAAESLRLYDNFYRELGSTLDRLVEVHGGFVLYDIHSYNHRRHGPGGDPEPSTDNPTVNLGTGTLPAKWSGVADAFLLAMRSKNFQGEAIDARENVKFKGRQIAAWTHQNYGDVGCALAIEFKKVFMDEWSDQVDLEAQAQLADALMNTVIPVLDSWEEAWQ